MDYIIVTVETNGRYVISIGYIAVCFETCQKMEKLTVFVFLVAIFLQLAFLPTIFALYFFSKTKKTYSNLITPLTFKGFFSVQLSEVNLISPNLPSVLVKSLENSINI